VILAFLLVCSIKIIGKKAWYYVNVERGNAADKLNGRNINVSFTNNSNVPIEVNLNFILIKLQLMLTQVLQLDTRTKNLLYYITIIIILNAFDHGFVSRV
jgi:hypothetical protein